MSVVKSLLAFTLGTASVLILGYCIYFDRQRRSDPNYRKKVHARRQRQEEKQLSFQKKRANEMDANERTQMRHFLREFKLGEQLINQGNITDGISHLAIAVMMFAQPVQGLRTLQETLPKHILMPLIMKLHEMQNISISSYTGSSSDCSTSSRDIL